MKQKILLVSVCLLTLTAGCVDPESTIILEEMNNSTEVAEHTTFKSENLREPIQIAVEKGESYKTVRGSKFDDEQKKVRYNNSVYSVTRENVDTTTVVEVTYRLSKTKKSADINSSELLKNEERSLAFSIEKLNVGEEYQNKSMISFKNTYENEESNESVLIGTNQTVVNYEGEDYLITISEKKNLEKDLYVYQRNLVSESLEEYGNEILNKYEFTLEDPSAETKELLSTSIEDGYYGEQNDKVEDLINRFKKEEAYTEDNYRGVWFVRYDGELYRSEITWISPLEDES